MSLATVEPCLDLYTVVFSFMNLLLFSYIRFCHLDVSAPSKLSHVVSRQLLIIYHSPSPILGDYASIKGYFASYSR